MSNRRRAVEVEKFVEIFNPGDVPQLMAELQINAALRGRRPIDDKPTDEFRFVHG